MRFEGAFTPDAEHGKTEGRRQGFEIVGMWHTHPGVAHWPFDGPRS